MPRRARLSIPGIPWHIIQRGNNKSACFYADDDYERYLDYLHEQAQKFACQIHAYVLMTNHVHLVITPQEEDSAALLMKNLGQKYVQYINRTYQRSGSLWEGRYKSCLIESENYLLACYRYVELNPVRAGMVKHPRDYRWSSFRVNAEGEGSSLISFHEQYLQLHLNADSRRKAYRRIFSVPVSQNLNNVIRSATNGNNVLGKSQFQYQIESMLGRRVCRGKPGRPKKIEGS